MLNILHLLEITYEVRSCPCAIMSPTAMQEFAMSGFCDLVCSAHTQYVEAEHVWTMNWAHKHSLISSGAIACILVSSIPAFFPRPF